MSGVDLKAGSTQKPDLFLDGALKDLLQANAAQYPVRISR
jgi:hypothetical protein